MKKILALLLATALGAPAFAQSTATPVVTGYLSTSACPYGQTTCFVQYGANSGGTTVTANQGTANAGGANAWPVQISQTTPGTSNGVQVNAALPAGTNVIGHVIADTGSTTAVTQATAANLNAQVQGPAAVGASPVGNPVQVAGVAQASEPALQSSTLLIDPMLDRVGKTVTSPYANRENMLRGAANTTGTGATTLLAAQGASVKTYITGLECSNTSATTNFITLNDSATSIFIVPNGGGTNIQFNVPLATAANTALTFTPSAGVTTEYCAVQGYAGY